MKSKKYIHCYCTLQSHSSDETVIFYLFIFYFLQYVTTPREVSKFFLNAVRETMDFRKNEKVKRNDFMQLLIQLKDKGELEDVDEKQNGKSMNLLGLQFKNWM